MARHARILQVFVSDEPALEETVDALLPGLGAGHIVLLHPTVPPDTVRAAAGRIAATGAAVLDAPFTGSREAAAQGRLVYYIGGDPAVLERARRVLTASSRSIVHLGGIGEAAIFKVATNLITATTIQALAEAVALVRAAGADPARLEQALESNAARSGAVDLKLPKILSGDYDPHFSLKHMAKDMRIAAAMAEAGGADLPVLRLIRDRLREGVDSGWGDADFSVLARRYGFDAAPPSATVKPAPQPGAPAPAKDPQPPGSDR